MANSVETAYKIKMFLNKFQIRTYVINPEQTKNFKKSIVHFFNIGQFNVLILIYGSSKQGELVYGDVLNVVCFDLP